ncbi:hypothetical protein, partial [Escherichia coli]
VTTKRIGKSILEKTLTRWPVFVDHFNGRVSKSEMAGILVASQKWTMPQRDWRIAIYYRI